MRNIHRQRLTAILLMLCASAPAWAALAKDAAQATCNGSTNSLACTLSGTPPDGSFEVACIGRKVSGGGESVTSITQTGATWTKMSGPVFQNPALAEAWYAENVTGAGTGITITMNVSRASAAVINVYTGGRLSGVRDANAAQAVAASGTTASSGQVDQVDLDQAPNALIACLTMADPATAAANFSAQTGSYVEEAEAGVSSNIGVVMERKFIAAGENATVSATIASHPWIGFMNVFKELPATQTVTITPAGSGKGRVTSIPAGLSCGTTCTFAFDAGTPVALTAEPVFDSTFAFYAGDTGCSTGTVTPGVSPINCTATFTSKPYRDLTIVKAGTGTGLVRSSGRGIDCGADCVDQMIDGKLVWLNAYPYADSVFAGWSGCATLTASVGKSVTMDTNRTCTATFNLVNHGVAASKLWYVRAGGNAACTGLADTDGASGACAKATLSQALAAMSCPNGDDIIVRGSTTYNDAATTQTPCDCPSRDDATNGPCVIQFDSTATIMNPGASAAALTLADGTSNLVDGIQIVSGRFKGGTQGGIRGRAGSTCTNITILDSLLTDMNQFPTKADPLPTAIQMACDSSGGIVADGFVIDGDETNCEAWGVTDGSRACGTDNGGGIFASRVFGMDARNGTIRDLLGGLGRPGSAGVWQDNFFQYVWCDGDSVDDGCIQLYNSNGMIFRRNQFWSVQVAENTGGIAQWKVIRSRRTSDTGCGSPPCGNPSGLTAYNNLFWLNDQPCSGTTTSCNPNTVGTAAGRLTNIIANDADGPDTQRAHAEFNSARNVFANVKAPGGTGKALFTSDSTGTPPGVSVCPSPNLFWAGDIFYNSDADMTNASTCAGTLTGYDSSEAQVNPNLDPNGRPTTWAAACFPVAGSDFTARDGDVADGWIGFSPGGCPSVVPPPPPPPSPRRVINLIISKLMPGVMPRELWRYAIAPGEVVGLWEEP